MTAALRTEYEKAAIRGEHRQRVAPQVASQPLAVGTILGKEIIMPQPDDLFVAVLVPRPDTNEPPCLCQNVKDTPGIVIEQRAHSVRRVINRHDTRTAIDLQCEFVRSRHRCKPADLPHGNR